MARAVCQASIRTRGAGWGPDQSGRCILRDDLERLEGLAIRARTAVIQTGHLTLTSRCRDLLQSVAPAVLVLVRVCSVVVELRDWRYSHPLRRGNDRVGRHAIGERLILLVICPEVVKHNGKLSCQRDDSPLFGSSVL